MMIQYMSITSDGVDVAEYYKNCGTYITEIAKRSGVCRGTVTHVIAGCAQESSSKAILEVLEQKSDEIYQQDIAACEAEVQAICKDVRDGWKNYRTRWMILDRLYAQYGIPRRKGQKLKKVTFRDIRKKSW
ncbi:hypothetical protein [Roseburia hominis]|uniref:hypothetical protein n=1 Tax=Roseburia hominis TaxID=301301 RepID=UPI00307F4853